MQCLRLWKIGSTAMRHYGRCQSGRNPWQAAEAAGAAGCGGGKLAMVRLRG